MAESHGPSPSTPPPSRWRSLEEYARTDEFRELLEREFPAEAANWPEVAADRREFLRVMAASLAMVGAAGCARQPEEKIVPNVATPELQPGQPGRLYATTGPDLDGGLGVLVRMHDGRPTKIEGNRQHPASLGGTDHFAQAAILSLYDPDRSQVIRRDGQISNRDALLDELTALRRRFLSSDGRGLHILTSPVHSPTLERQRDELQAEFPEARWYEFAPVDESASQEAARRAFGPGVQPRYRFDRADVILSIDADFLGSGTGHVRFTRDFAASRRAAVDDAGGDARMSRLYAVESSPSLTGANSDHRLPLSPPQIESFVRRLAVQLGLAGEPDDETAAQQSPSGVSQTWWNTLIQDLTAADRHPLIVAGPWVSAEVQTLIHAINDHLGAIGDTVVGAPDADAKSSTDHRRSLSELVDAMRGGNVEALLIADANPVFTAPADLQFADVLQDVPFSLHLGREQDETAVECTWHVPAAHFLEAWGDVRSRDGTLSVVQPVIAPLYAGHTLNQLLNGLLGRPGQSAYDTVRATWQTKNSVDAFDAWWQQSVHDGVRAGDPPESPDLTLQDDVRTLVEAVQDRPALEEPSTKDGSEAVTDNGSVTVIFRPHPTVHDGRYANNGWLLELPQPLTRLTWGNAAQLSPETAAQYSLSNGDVVRLEADDARVEIPVTIVPGHADGMVTVHFGCGRRNSGRVGTGVGVDVYPLRTTRQLWSRRVRMIPVGTRQQLSTTQHHFLMEDRDLVRTATFDEHGRGDRQDAEDTGGHGGHGEPLSFYSADHPQSDQQWGMSIDLTTCTGCSACVTACQAENNIPVVGPLEVARGREMHWIRVDTWYEGAPDNPDVHHQPVPCMHCEQAPCEVVCPVAATTHSDEGLNEMTYNRCIGTRYCSNNCPYKVRRFNFLDYQQEVRDTPVLQLLQNPDVTVRSRGVMEKCTYCVQRINSARIQSEMEDRPMQDGDVVTACQAVCPAEAIVFGDISDPGSAVARAKANPRRYGLLEELNTRPRTTYLSAVRNPHPAIREADE